MVSIFYLILISFAQGLIELLPVSSTAHILLITKLLNIKISSLSLSFFQFVAFVPVIVYYFVFICDLVFPWGYRRFLKLIVNLLFIVMPLFTIYIFFGKLLFSDFKLIALNLAFGGFLILIVEKFCDDEEIHSITDIGAKHALILGLFQVFALLPGLSRMGVNFVVSRVLKFSKSLSVDVGFLVGVPIIPGFFFCELVIVDAQIEITSMSVLLACCAVTIVVSALAIYPVIKFLKNNGMVLIAYYRIAVGLGIFTYLCVFGS